MRCILRAALFTLIFALAIIPASAQQFNSPSYSLVGPRGAEPAQIVTGDFNHDGNLDLAVANTLQGGVAILLGNGDGSFQTAKHLQVGSPIGLAVADLNADGNLDLVVVGYPQTAPLTVYLGNGDGTFTIKARYGLNDAPIALTVADFNGDGKLDVAVAQSNEFAQKKTGYISVFFGNGDGSLTHSANYNAGASPWGIAAGDLNGDGHPDIVVSSDNSSHVNNLNTLFVLLNNGDGTFTNSGVYQTGTESLNVSIADLNHDGKLDLVVASAFNQAVVVLLGNGDGTFSSPVFYSTSALGEAAYDIAVADFNADGIPDIAAELYDGGVVLLYGNGDGTFQSPVSTPSSKGGESLVVGDFNHDGAPDIASSVFAGAEAAVMLNAQ
jgi:hypothetical protein